MILITLARKTHSIIPDLTGFQASNNSYLRSNVLHSSIKTISVSKGRLGTTPPLDHPVGLNQPLEPPFCHSLLVPLRLFPTVTALLGRLLHLPLGLEQLLQIGVVAAGLEAGHGGAVVVDHGHECGVPVHVAPALAAVLAEVVPEVVHHVQDVVPREVAPRALVLVADRELERVPSPVELLHGYCVRISVNYPLLWLL